MILIISSSNDQSTIHVARWLNYFNRKFIILNELNKINKISISIESKCKPSIKIRLEDNNVYNLSAIKSVWYRRGDIYFTKELYLNDVKISAKFDEVLNKYNDSELENIKKYIVHFLDENCFNLSSLITVNQNKLIQLSIAIKNGLVVPKTLITSNKLDILAEFNIGYKLISKPISDCINYHSLDENVLIKSYTKILAKKTVKENTSKSATLVQNAIAKLYEIRTFYLLGELYSIAMYTQESKKTKVDSRNYDYSSPNYCMPYVLPKKISTNIVNLMNDLQLNTGSVDLIRNVNGEYVFLEVNPIGQFGNVSDIGGYNVELLIAKALVNEHRRKN